MVEEEEEEEEEDWVAVAILGGAMQTQARDFVKKSRKR